MLKFAIMDTGAGIREEDIPEIFDSSYQKERLRNKEIEGTRLGLAISQSLAKAMSGQIHVESVHGEGSTFHFLLPQMVSSYQKIAEIRNADKKKVLIFGNETSGNLLTKMVRQLGAKVRFVDTIIDVIEAIENEDVTHFFYNHEDLEPLFGIPESDLSNIIVAVIRKFSDITDRDYASKITLFVEPILITDIAALINKEKNGSEIVEKDVKNKRLSQIRGKDARVLVVDDNMVNLITAREILKQYDINCDVAESGKEAIEMVKNDNYDLIFMDQMMPEMDGVETTQAIRELDEKNKTLPIIALTANTVTGIKKYFLENGLDDFISKPIEINELDRVLKEWLPEDKVEIVDEIEVEDVEEVESCSSKLIQAIDAKDEFNIKEALSKFGGNESIFIPVVLSVGKAIKSWDSTLLGYQSNKDVSSFRIEIHAQKSSLASIGCLELSRQAKALEDYAAEGLTIDIDNFLKDYILKIRKLREDLHTIIADNYRDENDYSYNPYRGKGDLEVLTESAKFMLAKLDYLEPESIFDRCRELEKYDYGYSLNAKIKGIKHAVDEFNYEVARKFINDVIELNQDNDGDYY